MSVDGQVQDSETKTEAGQRVMALDPQTLAALRRVRRHLARGAAGCSARPARCSSSGPTAPRSTRTRSRRCSTSTSPRPAYRKIRLHDVRHSYATAALRSGISPKIVSERLGHANVAFTMQTYMHVIPGMDKAAADEVAALILGPAARRRRRPTTPWTQIWTPGAKNEPGNAS